MRVDPVQPVPLSLFLLYIITSGYLVNPQKLAEDSTFPTALWGSSHPHTALQKKAGADAPAPTLLGATVAVALILNLLSTAPVLLPDHHSLEVHPGAFFIDSLRAFDPILILFQSSANSRRDTLGSTQLSKTPIRPRP